MLDYNFRFWDEEMKSYWDWEEIQKDWEEMGYFSTAFRQDHWVCEQFIGLCDRNGKRIYGNDLVEYKGEIAQVFYSNCTACWGFCLLDSGYTDYAGDIKRLDLRTVDCVIIGNIHETSIKGLEFVDPTESENAFVNSKNGKIVNNKIQANKLANNKKLTNEYIIHAEDISPDPTGFMSESQIKRMVKGVK